MELIRGLHNLRQRHRGCVATVGAFDGVHRGHQWVLEHLKERAAERNLPTTVILFEPLPKEYIHPLEAPARIMNFREKALALAECGIDRVLRIRFNANVQQMTAESFIHDVFYQGLGVHYVVLGDDFRFGNDREGDAELMKQRGERYGFDCAATPTFTLAGERISSTRIRSVLAQGDFSAAAQLLGRSFSMSGKVVYGKQLGRQLGFPTANIRLHRLRAPINGVFSVRVDGPGLNAAAAIANVGTRPTIDDSIEANLEVHLIDRNVDLYGKRITVTFQHKVRDELKFSGIDQLKEQVLADIADTRRWFQQQDQ